jgi:hypothetical protein
MNPEPRWRTVLCWSAVVTFFSMPLVVFILHIVSVEKGWNMGQRWSEFTGIGLFYQIISALVFGLAGLNSWDRRTPLHLQSPPIPPKQSSTAVPAQQSKRSD